MSRRSFIQAFLILFAILAPGIREALAYSSEWSWHQLGSSTYFPTKTQVMAWIHAKASQDPRYGLLTTETTMYMSDTSERILLTGEPVAPILPEWGYFNGEVAGPGGSFPTDTALADAWIQAAPGSPQCGGTTSLVSANGYR